MVDTTQYKSNRYIIRLTIPVFIEILLAMLIGNVDQFMIKTQSDNAYAAIGNVNQIVNVFLMTFNVVAVASTILIAQNIGAKNREKVNELYSLSFYANFVFGLIVTAIVFIFYSPMFSWLKYPQEILHDSVVYIVIIGAGLILNSLMVTYSSFLRANGFMRECMYIAIIGNVINVIGNSLLIFGFFGIPKLGIAGVAIASDFSKLVSVILFIIIFKKRIGVKISIKKIIPFPLDDFKKMLGIGVPSAGESISFALVTIMVQKFINIFGKAVVTARVTVNMLTFISWIFATAISSTTQVVIGYLMGARDIDGSDKRFKTSRLLAMLFSLGGSLILYFLCKPICGIFVKDAAILDICQKIMFVEIFLEQGRAVNLVAVRSLQACGDTKFPIIIGIVVAWIVAVGGGYILGVVFDLGIVGVWIAMACDELTRAIIFSVRWKLGKWRKMTLVEKAVE